MLQEIKQPRVTDIAYHTLRQNILQHKFKAGQRLRVDELAEQMDVSRTPVREAINLLAMEGLVEILPRSGTFVASFTIQDIEETFDLRLVLESLAVELVAKKSLTDEQRWRLRDALVERGTDTESVEEKVVRHAEVNKNLHELIMEFADNQKLVKIYHTLNAHTMLAYVHHATLEWQKRWALEDQEHAQIVAAIERGDVAGAKAAMENHIRRGKVSLLNDLRQAPILDNRRQ